MTGWAREKCNNLDSCSVGTTHMFPDIGTKVLVPEMTELRVVASSRHISVMGQFVVTDVLHEAHQVALKVDDELVWADVDDDIIPIPD